MAQRRQYIRFNVSADKPELVDWGKGKDKIVWVNLDKKPFKVMFESDWPKEPKTLSSISPPPAHTLSVSLDGVPHKQAGYKYSIEMDDHPGKILDPRVIVEPQEGIWFPEFFRSPEFLGGVITGAILGLIVAFLIG